MSRRNGSAKGAAAAVVGGAWALWALGCASPLEASSTKDLRERVMAAAQRELEAAGQKPTQETQRSFDLSALGIKPEHLAEIEREYNPASYFSGGGGGSSLDRVEQVRSLLAEDLNGEATRVLAVGLFGAVRRAVERNLAVQEARFGPAIGEAQVAAAEAAFDWTFFNDFAWVDQDRPQPGPGFLGLNSVTAADQTVTNLTGLRRNLETGGRVELRQELVYNDVRDTGFGVLNTPNPASRADYVAEIAQPLLRGFGSDVALAEVRLGRNAERASVATLKQSLNETLTSVEGAYWDLVRAHRELVIASKLLERGEKVRGEVEGRRAFDAVQTQIADAVARVERRRGDIISAQRGLRRASDRLKALMNDPRIPVGSETLLVPVDEAIDEPLRYALLDSIQTAINERPEVSRALLEIDDASIRETVARNARLPLLDLRASATLRGFGESLADAFDTTGENEFVDDFVLGLLFEQPIGNRGPEANFRRRRLERLRGVVTYQRVVQDVVLDVKNALDNVVTNYRLIGQARTSRVAAAEALRTLQVEKQLTDVGYSVERLSVEFSQQEALASAERAEVQALINYNTAVAELHRAMGTTLERNRISFVVPDANQLAAGERALDFRVAEPSEGGEPEPAQAGSPAAVE